MEEHGGESSSLETAMEAVGQAVRLTRTSSALDKRLLWRDCCFQTAVDASLRE
jgi:hypothetical protein